MQREEEEKEEDESYDEADETIETARLRPQKKRVKVLSSIDMANQLERVGPAERAVGSIDS